MPGAPANRRRAGRYQVALAILRERHRDEFERILSALRSASASAAPGAPPCAGAVDGAADPTARQRDKAASSNHYETDPRGATRGPSTTSGGVSTTAARPS